MTMREVVEKYRTLASGFGQPVLLADFGLAPDETERVFSALDEDYHISRFFHFTLDRTLDKLPARTFRINSFPQSHVALDEGILEIL